MNSAHWKLAVESWKRDGWSKTKCLEFYKDSVLPYSREEHDAKVCLKTINDIYPDETTAEVKPMETIHFESEIVLGEPDITEEPKRKSGRPPKAK